MTLSNLINKAVEEFDKLEVKSFNLKTNKYQMEQLLILDDKGRKMVKSFLTKCIQESYEVGKKEERKKRINQICDASMMIETVLGYLEMGNPKQALKHLEVAQSILCPELQSLTKQSKEDKE